MAVAKISQQLKIVPWNLAKDLAKKEEGEIKLFKTLFTCFEIDLNGLLYRTHAFKAFMI